MITKSLYLKVNYKFFFVFVLLSSSIQGIEEENNHNKNSTYKDILPGKTNVTSPLFKVGGGGVCKVDSSSFFLLFYLSYCYTFVLLKPSLTNSSPNQLYVIKF